MIKIAWHWHKQMHRPMENKRNQIKSLHLWFILDKMPTTHKGKRPVFNDTGELGNHIQKKLGFHCTTHIQINLKCIKDINRGPKIIKLLDTVYGKGEKVPRTGH